MEINRWLPRKSKEFVRNGGIWQIDPVGLEDVQKNLQDDKKQALRKLFDVDVEKIDRSKGDLLDIRKAAAAARAFVYRIPSKIPPTDAAQATYWVSILAAKFYAWRPRTT